MLRNFVDIASFARYDSGSENLDKYEPRDILHCYVERRNQSIAVAERAER
jgi:hypothetical protein